jgi:hypothetical protein
MNSGIFNLHEISEVDMQSDEDKDELGLDKIEELLESSAKSARWSDAKDKVDDTGSEEARQSASKKRQRVDNDLTNDKDEHKKKKSKWDVVNESESGVVKLTGADMTVRTSILAFYTVINNAFRAWLARTPMKIPKLTRRKTIMTRVNRKKKRVHS